MKDELTSEDAYGIHIPTNVSEIARELHRETVEPTAAAEIDALVVQPEKARSRRRFIAHLLRLY